jgi:hypothetical protein
VLHPNLTSEPLFESNEASEANEAGLATTPAVLPSCTRSHGSQRSSSPCACR